jgi:uncharacterized linocin/CFP29 family protein
MTDILRRNLAPVTDAAWQEIERQSTRILKGNLSGRRLVDFQGPHGWGFAAVNLGRLDLGSGEALDGVPWGMRKALPLVEIRVPFKLGIWELDDVERGAKNPNLDGLTAAAVKAARFEEMAIYHGFGTAGIQGLLSASSHKPVPLGPDRSGLVESVESALLAIQEAGIGGPYALVLGKEPAAGGHGLPPDRAASQAGAGARADVRHGGLSSVDRTAHAVGGRRRRAPDGGAP